MILGSKDTYNVILKEHTTCTFAYVTLLSHSSAEKHRRLKFSFWWLLIIIVTKCQKTVLLEMNHTNNSIRLMGLLIVMQIDIPQLIAVKIKI